MKIQELTIYTSQLDEQRAFYSETLELPLLHQTTASFKVAIGSSILTFHDQHKATPYHFAFNIPSNQALEALTWLHKKNIPLLKDEDHELIDLRSWNALSIYFYDPDRNIVELIARKNLAIENRDPFNSHAFLCISEIGIPCTNIQHVYQALLPIDYFPRYDGDFSRFCAVGDESGLLILIQKEVREWFPTNDTAYSSNLQLLFENNHAEKKQLTFQNGKIIKPTQSW